MKKFKLTNKGMSIESAVVFMIVIFMFCAVIVSFSLYFNYQVKDDKTYIERKAELDQIGEDFIRYMKTKTNSENNSESTSETNLGNNPETTSETNSKSTFTIESNYYKISPNDNPNILEVSNMNNQTVLYIKLDSDNKVIKWYYSDPKQGE